MGKLENGNLIGSVNTNFGELTFRQRLGQNTFTKKPRNRTLVGVKTMDDAELAKLAKKTKYSVTDLKKIRAMQKGMKPAIKFCKDADLSADKYDPTKPGETRFNRCVGLHQSGEVGEKS